MPTYLFVLRCIVWSLRRDGTGWGWADPLEYQRGVIKPRGRGAELAKTANVHSPQELCFITGKKKPSL